MAAEQRYKFYHCGILFWNRRLNVLDFIEIKKKFRPQWFLISKIYQWVYGYTKRNTHTIFNMYKLYVSEISKFIIYTRTFVPGLLTPKISTVWSCRPSPCGNVQSDYWRSEVLTTGLLKVCSCIAVWSVSVRSASAVPTETVSRPARGQQHSPEWTFDSKLFKQQLWCLIFQMTRRGKKHVGYKTKTGSNKQELSFTFLSEILLKLWATR